ARGHPPRRKSRQFRQPVAAMAGVRVPLRLDRSRHLLGPGRRGPSAHRSVHPDPRGIRIDHGGTERLPRGPPDAQVYNPASGAWEAVAPGTNARSEVTFNYTFGNWHHGPAMDMNDVLYDVALIARRAGGDVAAHDPDAL